MLQDPFSYMSLLVIVLIAVFVPMIVNKIKFISIPIVVGEIIAGMIIGKSGLALIGTSTYLQILYDLGFAFLMFMSGLEINLDLMAPLKTNGAAGKRSQPMLVAIKYFILILVVSFSIALLLKYLGMASDVLLLVIIFSSRATGIVVPILKETGLLGTEYGQTILSISLLGDLSTMILLSVIVALQTSKSIKGLLLIVLLIPAFFIVYKIYSKVMKHPIFEELDHKNSQIKTRITFALLILFLALAQALKIEMILGAFLAGLIVSLTNDREQSQIYQKLDAIGYGFFIPLCFIMIGINFDLKDIINTPGSVYLLPVLLGVIYVSSLISTIILRVNYSWRQSLAAVMLLSTRLSVIIAAGAIGVQYGIIGRGLNAMIVLVAIITCTLSPLIFKHLSCNTRGKIPVPDATNL